MGERNSKFSDNKKQEAESQVYLPFTPCPKLPHGSTGIAYVGDSVMFVKSVTYPNIIWRHITDGVSEPVSDIKFSEDATIKTMFVLPSNKWLVISYTYQYGNGVGALRIISLDDYSVLYDGYSIWWSPPCVLSISRDERMLVIDRWEIPGQGLGGGKCDVLELHNSFLDNL